MPTISLTDPQSQQMELQRRQRLAEMLAQQANEPVQVNAYKGIQAPIGAPAMMAKILQQGLAGWEQGAADKKSDDMQVQNQKAMASILGQWTPESTNSTLPSDAGNIPQDGSAPAQNATTTTPGHFSGGAMGDVDARVGQLAQALPNGQGLNLLVQSLMGKKTALTPEEIQQRHLRPGGSYEKDISGNVDVLQQPDTLSPDRIAQNDAQEMKGAFSPIPAGDPAYQGFRPGTILSRDRFGNVKELQKSDVKSKEAEAQEIRIDNNKASAAARASMAAYGINPNDPGSNPVVQSYVKNIRNGAATLQNVPQGLRGAVSVAMAGDDKTQYTPTAASRFSIAASRITSAYKDMSGYKLTADAVPYLARIDAASKVPGSVSDQDLLDSLTKLNTGGNAVTDAQVALITNGKSFSDWASTLSNRFKNGGVLSNDQRKEIRDIAGNIYQNYRKTYQPIYEKAAKQLEDSGIPKAFWTIPDLNAIGDEQMQGIGLPNPSAGNAGAATGAPQVAPAGTKAVGPNGHVLTSDGKGGWN